jgi:hypothetical protein
MATSTPWGAAQSSHRIAAGIVSYTTAGHGGIHLTARRVKQMPDAIQQALKNSLEPAGDAWFEEDGDWALVALSFPECFPDDQVSAEVTVRNQYPEVWESFYGKVLEPGQSRSRDEKLFYEAHADDWLVTAAWGDWAEHVPQGMVGVCAVKGGRGRRISTTIETWWLVPKQEYAERQGFAFVIDPQRHQQVDTPLGAMKQSAA